MSTIFMCHPELVEGSRSPPSSNVKHAMGHLSPGPRILRRRDLSTALEKTRWIERTSGEYLEEMQKNEILRLRLRMTLVAEWSLGNTCYSAMSQEPSRQTVLLQQSRSRVQGWKRRAQQW